MKVWKCEECNRGPCKIETNLEMDALVVDFLPCDNDAKWQETDEFEIIEKPKKKEPELMTLQEAHEKAKKGDRVFYGGLGYVKGDPIESQDHILPTQALDKGWKIMPAEPKVLSVEEMFTNTFDEHHPLYGYKRFIIDLLKAVHNNGRLERDLELKPLLDFIGKHSPGDRIDVSRLYEIYVDIENLKPVEDK
jgi:hypothetical protein